MSKRGLGRGLDALLGGNTADLTAARPVSPGLQDTPSAKASDNGPGAERALQPIALARITPNPYQPRKTFDAAALDELRASIATFGVLVPVIVRARGDGYELIAGERRLRAAQLAGLVTIPAIVRPSDDRETLEVAIIENLQRENLDALEEAMGFAHLTEAYGFTQEQVAERVGKSRASVANALRLLSLGDAIKQHLRDGTLSAGHARALLMLPPERRDAMARRAIDDDLSVRALERLAHENGVPKRVRAAARHASSDDEALVDRLRFRFATQVRVLAQARGGTIELRYSDAGDLMRIADLLLGETS